MTHHEWGDKDFDWKGLDDCCNIIITICRRYGRFGGQIKEKYGTIRFSSYMGYISLHSLIYPGYAWSQFPKWLWSFDIWYSGPFLQKYFGKMIFWWQRKVYNYAYQKAVKKYPHLKDEILCDADFPEYIIPYGQEVHDKYWTTVE